MSIAEVEKLWLRFQQMECNPSGVTSSLEIKVELYMLDYLFQWVSLRWRDCGWGFSRWDVTPALRRKKKGCTLHVGLLVSVSVAEVETYLWLRFQQMGCNASAWEKNTHEGCTLHVGLLVSVSIAEVERLWLRFQQMGCNADGVLTSDVINTPALSSDVFIKNVCFC